MKIVKFWKIRPSEDSLSTNLQDTYTAELDIEDGTRAFFMSHEDMLFQSQEEAYNFYNSFGLTKGCAIGNFYIYKSYGEKNVCI